VVHAFRCVGCVRFGCLLCRAARLASSLSSLLCRVLHAKKCICVFKPADSRAVTGNTQYGTQRVLTARTHNPMGDSGKVRPYLQSEQSIPSRRRMLLDSTINESIAKGKLTDSYAGAALCVPDNGRVASQVLDISKILPKFTSPSLESSFRVDKYRYSRSRVDVPVSACVGCAVAVGSVCAIVQFESLQASGGIFIAAGALSFLIGVLLIILRRSLGVVGIECAIAAHFTLGVRSHPVVVASRNVTSAARFCCLVRRLRPVYLWEQRCPSCVWYY
jgi:hypothetical protein